MPQQPPPLHPGHLRRPQQLCPYMTALVAVHLLMTVPTPVVRLTEGRWFISSVFVLPLMLLNSGLRLVGRTAHQVDLNNTAIYPAYGTDRDMPGIDLAFGSHAAAGLLWVVAGYVQIVSAIGTGWVSHKRFSRPARAAYAAHCSVALYTLYVDTQSHHPLPRLLLMICCVMQSIVFMIRG